MTIPMQSINPDHEAIRKGLEEECKAWLSAGNRIQLVEFGVSGLDPKAHTPEGNNKRAWQKKQHEMMVRSKGSI